MMKKLALMAAAWLVAMSASQAHAVTIELKAAHSGTTDYLYHKAFEKMAELMAERSKGELKLNIYPDAALGGEVKLMQSVRTGVVDITAVASPVVESFASEYAVFSFPYLFSGREQADKLLRGPMGKEFLDLLPPHGVVGLGFLSTNERNIYTTGKLIEKAEDVRGLKIRVIQSPGFVTAYSALGAQPTPMSSSELYLALQYGTVDAGDTSPDTFVALKYPEVAKVYSMTKIHFLPTIMVMSKSKLEALSPEQQDIVLKAAHEGIEFAMTGYSETYAKSLEKIKSAGVNVIEPDVASFRATAPEVYAKLLEAFPQVKPWLEKIQAAAKQ